MTDAILTQLRDLIQNDIGARGLATDPTHNLINACPDDFRLACHSLAEHPRPGLAVVTGFFIPGAAPPAGETDGPLGALFLARALVPLGIPVVLVTDSFCVRALEAGLAECGLRKQVPIVTLPTPAQADTMEFQYWRYFDDRKVIATLSHLLAIERVGPNHIDDRCHTMRGQDITDLMSPAHRLFDDLSNPEAIAEKFSDPSRALRTLRAITTIGIGDGGNEIGMGKIPRAIIERNIANGGLIACRVPTEHQIVCGVSNWGAYALAAGVGLLRQQAMDPHLFDPAREFEILELMVEEGPLVDGVLGKPSATVDGLTWEQYADVLTRIGEIVRSNA